MSQHRLDVQFGTKWPKLRNTQSDGNITVFIVVFSIFSSYGTHLTKLRFNNKKKFIQKSHLVPQWKRNRKNITVDVIQVVIFNLILKVYYECNSQETSLSVGIVLMEKDV